jgi:WS/DGAT/MGAT family acyltransferase
MRLPVAGNDAIWLQDTATNPMVINAVITTDRLDLQTLRDTFRVRVLEAEGGRRYARFRHRVVWHGSSPGWEEDPDFDISRHIFAASDPGIGTTEQLQRFAGAEASRPLPEDRPRWQFHFVDQFEDGSSALVVRIHHSIADGIALMAVIFAFMEEMTVEHTAVPRGAIRPAAGAPGSGLLRMIAVPLAAPGILIRRLLWVPDRHALHGPPVSGRKLVAWTAPLDLEVVKAAKNRLNATVNDVLMASVSGAISRYLLEHAGQTISRVRVSMPVNVRRYDEPLTMENKFAAVPLELPAGIPDLALRVARVKQRMDELKRSAAPIVVYGIQRALLAALPQAVSRWLIDFLANKCTAVVTNVPGPQRELTLAGRRVRNMMFWVPQRANIGLGISVLSFAGKVQVGVIVDAHLIPDARDLTRAFEEEFQALRAL